MTSPTQSTEVPDSAVRPAAKVIARALRHRAEQIERGTMGDRQTETPNQIAEKALADAAPALLKQGAEEERERLLAALIDPLRTAVKRFIDDGAKGGIGGRHGCYDSFCGGNSHTKLCRATGALVGDFAALSDNQEAS